MADMGARARRVAFDCGAAVSFLLFVGAGVMWVRSYIVGERWNFAPRGAVTTQVFFQGLASRWQAQYCVESARGVVQVVRRDQTTDSHARPGWERAELTRLKLDEPAETGWTFAGFHFYHAGRRANQMGGMMAQYWGFTVVGVPYWIVMAGTAVWPGVWLRRRVRMKRGPGFCERCGYDLRASVGRCPECGEGIGGGTHKDRRHET